MLNMIVLAGRLTRDPELRYSGNNIPVCSFSIACDRDFGGPSGEKVSDFIDVVAWRNNATFTSQYFSKGDMIIVAGRLQIRSWTDKAGNKRRTAEVVADNVYFGGSSRKNSTQTDSFAPPAGIPQSTFNLPQVGESEFAAFEDDDSDLPF